MIKLEDYVSRTDCISNRLNYQSWNSEGVTNFFTLNVPFSYSTSHVFAKRILKLVETYDRTYKKDRIKLADIGSGTGLLAYRLLEVAYEQNPKLAKKLEIHVTDFSDEILESIQSNWILRKYNDQIHYKCFDLFKDSVEKISDADIVLMVYVLDIDAVHLDYESGSLMEWKLSSYVDDNAYVLDSTEFPPKLIKGQALQSLFQEAVSGKKPHLCTKLADLIQEDWKKHDYDFDDSPLLKSYLKETSTDLKFNYSPAIYHFLQDLISLCKEKNKMAIIFDFGVPSEEAGISNLEGYMAQYGIGSYYTVQFPLIHHIVEQEEMSYFQTDFESGHSQWCVIHPEDFSFRELSKHFEEKDAKVTENILYYLENWQRLDVSVRDTIPGLLADLPEDEKKKHSVLLWSAKFYKELGNFERCYSQLDQLTAFNGSMSLAGFHLRLEALNAEGKFEKALNFAKQMETITTNHVGILYQRCFASGQVSKQEKEFIESVKQFLIYSDHFVPWRFIIAMISAYLTLSCHKEAQLLFESFSDINTELNLNYDDDLSVLAQSLKSSH